MKQKVTLLLVATLWVFVCFAQQRVRYSGSHHTVSHGGTYQNGQGSSHKGGHYKNVKTNNQYGKHKK